MRHRKQPLGRRREEWDRLEEQAGYDLEDGGTVGNLGHSPTDTRACLETVNPDAPHLTAVLWWVREAFLRHVKPKRGPLPSTRAVVEYLGCTPEDVEAALAWLRTEGAWTPYVAPVKHARKKQQQPPPSEAEAVLNQRAIIEMGHAKGITLNDLTLDEVDALFPIVARLRKATTRVCPGCNIPMLDKRHKNDPLGFDPQAKSCSDACRQRTSRANRAD